MPEQFDFDGLERPLVVLVGGGSGVGKSTVATQLAHSLGIPRLSSTDFIRAVLRSVLPDAIAPELSRSSFELDQGLSHNDAAPHAQFERQAQQVLVGVRAMIERAVLERAPFILEGVHLLPGLVDLDVTDSVVVHVILTVDESDEHSRRFALRAEGSGRPARRYDEGLEAIRQLQEHIVAAAHRSGVAVLENQQLDTTVRRVRELIFAAVDGVLPRRGLQPVRGDVAA
jgi:2-phosphoglycerate kinase